MHGQQPSSNFTGANLAVSAQQAQRFVGGTALSESTEIDRELDRLKAALHLVESTQARLASRLAPISSPPHAGESGTVIGEPSPSSRVGGDVRAAALHAERIAGYLEECIRLLAI